VRDVLIGLAIAAVAIVMGAPAWAIFLTAVVLYAIGDTHRPVPRRE
jgi:hypothetical protein